MDDGSDDDSDVGNGGKGGFSSDDDDELLENVGIKEKSFHQANLDASDAFDSLKEEDSPAKKAPAKRKLGAKPEVVKAPTLKRPKKQISDSDDSPVKVIS